jgi:hypothetical protein
MDAGLVAHDGQLEVSSLAGCSGESGRDGGGGEDELVHA